MPAAAGLTTGELRAEVNQAILALDPAAMRRRRQEAERGARVECYTNPDGTATLTGRWLPPAEVLAADKRLCQVAAWWKKQIRAAWKQADPAGELARPEHGTDLLRARAYLALLLGQPLDTPPADLLPPAEPAPAQTTLPARRRPPGQHRPPGRPGRPEGQPGRPWQGQCRRYGPPGRSRWPAAARRAAPPRPGPRALPRRPGRRAAAAGRHDQPHPAAGHPARPDRPARRRRRLRPAARRRRPRPGHRRHPTPRGQLGPDHHRPARPRHRLRPRPPLQTHPRPPRRRLDHHPHHPAHRRRSLPITRAHPA